MNNKGNTAIIVILSVTAILLLAGLAYLFGQNKNINDELLEMEAARKMQGEASDKVVVATEPAPNNATGSSAVVVYEAEGSFIKTDKDQLKERISEPFLDYYQDLNGADYVSTLSFFKNQEDSKADYPYGARFIFRDGVNGGFLITKTDGEVDWWIPECMGDCPFSESFKNKYPEIIEKLTPQN